MINPPVCLLGIFYALTQPRPPQNLANTPSFQNWGFKSSLIWGVAVHAIQVTNNYVPNPEANSICNCVSVKLHLRRKQTNKETKIQTPGIEYGAF